MPDVDFPIGLEGRSTLPKTRKSLVNCWNTNGDIISRPGITQLNTTGKVARGQFRYNDALYQVVSDQLIKITNVETGAYSVIGTIAGTAVIDHAIGFNHAVIIVKGGNGYTLNTSDTLTQITDVDFVASDSVTHINGRFIYIPSNGDPAIYSDVGDGATIQTNSFFDAEELPDKNKVCINYKNTLYIGGTDSFELFRATTGASVSFTRLSNGRVQYGYVGGILEYLDTFIFIGRESDQGVGIYAMDSGRATKISNEWIDAILETYTPEELNDVIAGRFKWRGDDIAYFTLPNHSFGFNGGWFELSTFLNGASGLWQGGYITHLNGKYYTANSGKIGVLADVHSDYGEVFEKRIDMAFESPDNAEFSAQSVELSMSQGFTISGSVGLQVSRDNTLYSEPLYRTTGAIGEYEQKLEWNYPGGLGYFNGFMGIRLITTSNIDFSSSKVSVRMR